MNWKNTLLQTIFLAVFIFILFSLAGRPGAGLEPEHTSENGHAHSLP